MLFRGRVNSFKDWMVENKGGEGKGLEGVVTGTDGDPDTP